MKAILLLLTLLASTRIGLSQCNPAGLGTAACHALSAPEIEAAVRASLGQPSSDAGQSFRIEILDQSRSLFPEGQLIFPLSTPVAASPDGVSVLHGYLESITAVRHPVWARVRMSARKMTPVALRDLAIGTILSDGQWEASPVWVPFPESTADSSNWDGKTLAGARLKRAMKQGDILRAQWLDVPLDIRRGQLVDLHVQSGGTHLRLQATALGNSRRGENVEVRLNNDRGPGLLAVTSGPGRAVVDTKNHDGAHTEGKR
jgi:flagella basal body P-ring formation protein FlgA